MSKSTAMVYAIGNAGSEIVKVGVSVEPLKRLAVIRRAWVPDGVDRHALAILRLYCAPNGRALERAVHWALGPGRIRVDVASIQGEKNGCTEWFRVPSALANFDWAVSRYAESAGAHLDDLLTPHN